MERSIVSIAIIASVFAAKFIHQPAEAVSEREWLAYKETFNKSYDGSSLEDWIRRELYTDSLEEVGEFNAKLGPASGFYLGINQFSDLTKSELGRLGAVGSSQNIVNSARAEEFLRDLLGDDKRQEVPSQLDWRQFPNRVGRVKNQSLKCRSSWPFVATGVLEGQLAIRGGAGKLVELSEQNLLDCVSGNLGCSGGLLEAAFLFVQQHGLASEASYPYAGGELGKTCKFSQTTSLMRGAKGYAILPKANELALQRAVARFGPVAAIVSLSPEFVKYKSGVFSQKLEPTCNRKRNNHAVLVVGYGADHWIIKNSWGVQWGEGGFARLARNRQNNAGIACNAMIPIF